MCIVIIPYLTTTQPAPKKSHCSIQTPNLLNFTQLLCDPNNLCFGSVGNVVSNHKPIFWKLTLCYDVSSQVFFVVMACWCQWRRLMTSSFFAIKQQPRKPVMTRASFRPRRSVKMSAASSMAGLLSYFGLDEYSRLERKYTREIEDGSSNKDFEANLKDVLKMGILSMKVL